MRAQRPSERAAPQIAKPAVTSPRLRQQRCPFFRLQNHQATPLQARASCRLDLCSAQVPVRAPQGASLQLRLQLSAPAVNRSA